MEAEDEELLQAYKQERDPAKRERLHAVCLLKINGRSIAHVADEFYCDIHTISKWLDLFRAKGIKGLDNP